MITYFCKPKLKVGTECVQKGSTCTNAANSVAGIARAIYERTFRITVDKCNETLCDPTMKKVTYIGVLDIAGFEIFDYNGFEQICINYVNEMLQEQFNESVFTAEHRQFVPFEDLPEAYVMALVAAEVEARGGKWARLGGQSGEGARR